MRKLVNVLAVIALCANLEAIAQKPIILSTDKDNGGQREVVTLRGSDFGIDKTKLKVFFGAAAGEIKEVSNQVMEVRVPPGATYDNISVTNTINGLTGYAPGLFSLKFNGKHGLTASNFNEEAHFDAEDGLYDLCLCDFNGDNKVDIATASDKSSGMIVFRNNSTLASINLDDNFILINRKSLHITCGDLNGDGLPDMAASEGADGDRVYIYRNTGTGSFSNNFIPVAGKKVKRVAIADLDLDGKPELVVTDKGGNTITIFPNQSTAGGAITFGAPIAVPVADVPSTDALDVKDLNGDGLPEIITSKFNTDISNVYILQNKSTPGNFNFSDIITFNITGSVVNLRVGDLDGDHKPDIAATRFLGSDVVILLNQSTSSQIAFKTPVSFAATTLPSGLDFGDLDGDGKTDIVVGSISVKSLVILNNKSTPGALSFEPALNLPTDFVSRHVRIGDLDGDGKPDITYTSVDNDGVTVSKISAFRNKACFVPVLSPAGPLTICNGFPLQLASSTSGGVTYSWQKSGAPVTGTNPFLDISASGAYTVTATSEAGACTEISAPVNITVAAPGAGLNPGDADARSNSPVCTENPLNLQVNDLAATGYTWTGPGGFTSNIRTPTISSFSIDKAGVYVVELIKNGCVAKVDSTIVEGINNPDFTVTFSGSELLCQGTTKALTVSPVLTSGFTYKWFQTGQGQIPGQATGKYDVTASGEYYATVASTHLGCAPVETPKVTITAVAVPDAAFTPSTTSGCVAQEITFTNQSVVDPQVTPIYTWTFADNSPNSSETSPKHTYTQPLTYPVKLRVTYKDGICPNEETVPVSIVLAPAVTITNPGNSFKLCASDTLRLVASGDAFASYAWSTGETTPFIIVDEAQTYSVSVTNSMGCVLQASQAVTPVPAPTVTAAAVPEVITVGQRSMLSGTGLENYGWSPGLSLNDSTIANPVATPLQDITYTFSGTDINGCKGEATVSIRVLGTSVMDQLKPKSYFSPNDDIDNPFWEVQNIQSFPECGVAIFNDKGAKVFEAKPYNSDWDGTFKGSRLPSGVYYYVIRCDDESRVKTGSITLLK